ncbi:MAG: hypothetical protein COV41_00265 [Candidatus Brennerbacteria bacterium CG11_big_fil_rev_8_21_14_0_20_43_10]|uniref:Uncharacterized protein n=3 Tax=Candidatus Brenneribacteriota TaxID=1817902 RepID=A0A2M8C194_9BACT|nr:MAG: hypothetical protein AUJ43_02200 [Parcubacteria group bacterium CG1_02_44_31]PIP50235.1 MAG: hypothetical protein COX12_02420 [Candidatus Brennerbacteria bacterium CG23_combo_of_CG06-09_8_20_14_all_44_41]PIR26952.1 MAG: hypothetical protein COV41_00265 [Candidatus Brennerbacteria bacterium CG11_big_fil_rev_8_21_14_0_20_43_10]PIX28687.1 MAG: hypothetical protein COZ64_02305 [Candidatus Brennerbacteria bacterium CG_4_8_14_3_um_filter_43_14]PJA19121.1 MAG: hypothetical protein COX61_02015 
MIFYHKRQHYIIYHNYCNGTNIYDIKDERSRLLTGQAPHAKFWCGGKGVEREQKTSPLLAALIAHNQEYK